MSDDRAAWTTYARQEGLLRADPPGTPPPNKYHAIPVHVDGVRFASQKEAARYQALCLWLTAGQIAALEIHPVFALVIHGQRIGRYTADFRYLRLDTGEIIVEDTKSAPTKTEAYRLRKRLAEVLHGMTVTEV